MKYQFSIRIGKSGDKNSAATKAVLDCNTIFSQYGYKDYNLVFSENENRINYYLSLSKALITFLIRLKKGSIVGIQYPMLNNIFKFFIRAARKKHVKFFCIIHDIESLRLGGTDVNGVKKEVMNLNYYDCLIVHNLKMLRWLKDKGITKKMIPLMVFDYLLQGIEGGTNDPAFSNTICFAGNLTKSSFIYQLNEIDNWNFNVYGPNFQKGKVNSQNLNFNGEFSPEQIVYELKGDFGLIWDGDSIDKCDLILGNYLRYNNPHKFSLYIAAGLPVIAPANSAIGEIIQEYNIGILVNSLYDLKNLHVSKNEYKILKENCIQIHKKVINGSYFSYALTQVEKELQ